MLATGLSFEVVANFTPVQFIAVQEAIQRHWNLLSKINGLQALFGMGKENPKDDTEAFEAKVKALKRLTGKKVLDLWEVVGK